MTKNIKLVLLALALSAQPVFAASITGLGAPSSHPALSGATVIDFSATPQATYNTLNTGGVDISSGDAGTFSITSSLGGSFNTQGANLQNGTSGAAVLDFDFNGTVSAFGFNFGASNEDWRLEAFDAGANLLDSFILTQTWFSNSGEYFGLAAIGIASARLTQLTNVNDQDTDHILLDNLSFVPAAVNGVPEPGSLALLGLAALAGLAASRRRAC